jgi:preprotein translocase subunit SecB
MSEQQNASHFSIEKIFLSDLSFESPQSPQIFTKAFQSTMDLQVKVDPMRVGEHHWQVALRLTITVRVEDQAAFLIEVEQSGLFAIANFADADMEHLLNSYCPNLLFPYARETVAMLSLKGGFPPLELQPLNFDALYAQQQASVDNEAVAAV